MRDSGRVPQHVTDLSRMKKQMVLTVKEPLTPPSTTSCSIQTHPTKTH